MGVGPEGQPRPTATTRARCSDVRLVFFLQEALRALRRNGAPTLAAVVTTVVTVILLGVLIPIFQTTQAKSEEVRSELNIQVGLFDDATPAETAALKDDLKAIPHVDPGHLHQQGRGAERPCAAN